MKKLIIMAYLMILSLSAVIAVPVNTDNNVSDKLANNTKKEYKLSDEEANRLLRRADEIRHMDKSTMTAKEKRETRKELRALEHIKHKDGGYYVVYFSGGTLLLILILIILL